MESDRQNVRVAKESGYLLVKVTENPAWREKHVDQQSGSEKPRHHGPENVEVRIPMDVVDALLSGNRDELDILAAVKALARHPDLAIINVSDAHNTVRVWVDNAADTH